LHAEGLTGRDVELDAVVPWFDWVAQGGEVGRGGVYGKVEIGPGKRKAEEVSLGGSPLRVWGDEGCEGDVWIVAKG